MYHVRFVVLANGTFHELLVDAGAIKALEKLQHDTIQLFYKRKWGEWKHEIPREKK